MVLRTGKGELPLPGLPIPQFDIRTALARGERPAPAGGDPPSIRAEGDRVDTSSRRLPGQSLGVAEPIDVMPLPAAAFAPAAAQQGLGQAVASVLPFA